jgi:NADH-quinone oxidoreductase subunit M
MLATLFVISGLAMIGLPMLNGFVGEFLVLSSTFTGVSRSWAAVATIGVILSAAYMLSLVQKIFYGPPAASVTGNPLPNALLDLSLKEKIILYSLATLMLVMGVFPNIWLSGIQSQAQETVRWSSLKPWIERDCAHRPCRTEAGFFIYSGTATPQIGDRVPLPGGQQ